MAPRRSPEVAERRERVAVMFLEGRTVVETALELRTTPASVEKDRGLLRAEGRLELPSRRPYAPLDWDKLQMCWNHGFAVGDLAKMFNTTPDAARHAMQRMRDRGIELYAERDPRRCGLVESSESSRDAA